MAWYSEIKEGLNNFFGVEPYTNPTNRNTSAVPYKNVTAGGSTNSTKNLSNKIFPASLDRARKDISDWKEAVEEMERGWLPYRTKVQQLYEVTVLNEHVAACIERRKDLTLLRDFEIQDANGKVDKKWTEYFKKTWYAHNFLNYALDALFYGYNLIAIGDIKDGVPVFPSIIRRTNISPERRVVSPFVSNPNGWSWDDPRYEKYHIWIPTLPTNGFSVCGYGLLYNVAKTEIYLRNNLAFNVDFIQMFAQPYRVMRTSKTEGAERDEAEKALANMGSAGYMLLDMMDELEFLDGSARGNGYKSYNDIEQRLEAKISKYLLGHADAIDSVPGKLGATQLSQTGSKTDDAAAATPVAKALRDKQTKDGGFVEPITNELLIPKLQKLGIGIPKGHRIKFLNDAEERAIQDEKNSTNQKMATMVMTFAQAGVKVSNEYITQHTGIEVTDMPQPIVNTPNPAKEPKEQIESGDPLKDSSKNRDGKQ